MSAAENKVIEAVEQTVESEEAVAAADIEASEAEAAKNTSEAAATAVAAAEAGAALATAEAAKTLNEREGELEWLKQHAAAVDGSLKNLETSLTETRSSMEQNLAGISTALQSLTRQKSESQETEAVNPQDQAKPKESPEDSRDSAPKEKPKTKRRFI